MKILSLRLFKWIVMVTKVEIVMVTKVDVVKEECHQPPPYPDLVLSILEGVSTPAT